jgi:hypothetical protein
VPSPISRLRLRRVRWNPIAVIACTTARVALQAARAAATHAAASAARLALKHGLIGTRAVIPNAIKWGPGVVSRAGVNQATRTIERGPPGEEQDGPEPLQDGWQERLDRPLGRLSIELLR